MSATPIADERFLPKADRNILTDPSKGIGKQSHNGEPMTKAEQAEMAELKELVHQYVMMSRLGQMPATTNGNGLGAWGRTFVTIAVVLVGWIFTALYIAKTTETEIRVSNAILTEQLKETRGQFDEYRRASDLKLALLDERARQISIQLEARGIKPPAQSQ